MGVKLLHIATASVLVLGLVARPTLAHGTELVALRARLSVAGAPPVGGTFFLVVSDPASGNRIGFQLADPDGDGVYTADADAFEPDQTVPVRLERGTGTTANPIFGGASKLPGAPASTIRDFGRLVLHSDTVLTASAAFGGARSAEPVAVAAGGYLSMAALGTVLLTASLYALHRHRRRSGETP